MTKAKPAASVAVYKELCHSGTNQPSPNFSPKVWQGEQEQGKGVFFMSETISENESLGVNMALLDAKKEAP